MKVLLIEPADKRINSGNCVPNIGLMYIAGYLKRNNIDVEILDLQTESYRVNKKYDIIGITTKTPSIYKAWKIAKDLKQSYPNVKIVLGGNHVSALPEESLKHSFIDIIVRGEGEETFLKICQGKAFNKIKGISYKIKGKIKHNKDRPYIKDLDKLPYPAYNMLDLNKYGSVQIYETTKRGLGIITSRGCPYNCNFCFKGTFGCEWRARRPVNIYNEIMYYKHRYGIEEIAIWDDCFNLDIKRAIKICKLIKSTGLDWCLPNGIRVDNITEELAKEMKESNCKRINLGIEHGNQLMLDKIGKGTTLKQVKKACKILKKNKIKLKGFFILGNIGETKETMQETIDFACSLPLDYASFMIATPFPATKLYKEIKRKTTNWEEMSHIKFGNRAYFETKDFTKEDVNYYYKKAFKKFYFRPKILIKMMLNKNHWKNIGRVLHRLRKEVL